MAVHSVTEPGTYKLDGFSAGCKIVEVRKDSEISWSFGKCQSGNFCVKNSGRNWLKKLIEKFQGNCFYAVDIKTKALYIFVEIQVYNLSNVYSETKVPLW